MLHVYKSNLLIPEALSPDSLKVQKMFDSTQCGNKSLLQVFIAIVNYVSDSLPSLVSTAAMLPDLQGTTRT